MREYSITSMAHQKNLYLKIYQMEKMFYLTLIGKEQSKLKLKKLISKLFLFLYYRQVEEYYENDYQIEI